MSGKVFPNVVGGGQDQLFMLVTALDYSGAIMGGILLKTIEEFQQPCMDQIGGVRHAIGKMMGELETRGLLDNTTIVVFGDHNAYYHSLSKYVKDIHDYETEKRYTDLYNVPLMIYDKKLSSEIAKTENGGGADMVVDKFTCTADIASTILDLLGIHYYENLYYGTSVFNEEASVLYSRAYDTFIASGIVGTSVNNLLYKHPNADVETYKTSAIKLVNKIKHCDYIYKQNYFGNAGNMTLYLQKMAEINR